MTMPANSVSDGTCAESACRVMPDIWCRECRRWYCGTHGVHGESHVLITVPAVPAAGGRRRRQTVA